MYSAVSPSYFLAQCKILANNAPGTCCSDEAQIAEPINWLPPFVRLHRPLTRTPKNLDGLITYLQMSLTPGEVPVIGEPFGRLHEIKFDDHELANLEAFPELAPELYLDRVQEDDGLKIFPMRWVHGIARSRLLNLLRMPHFGHYNITYRLARQFLTLIHDGCLWI